MFQIIINVMEHLMNTGKAFITTDIDTDVDIAGPKYYKITTPNTTVWSRLKVKATLAGAALIEIYEAPTFGTSPAAGTALTAINVNRNSAKTATLGIKYDSTLGTGETAEGTKVWQYKLAAAGSFESDKLVLKQNTVYHVKITSDGDNNKLWINFNWDEQ
jgi:phosphoribosylformylglycinamidine (FGAM) synthase-like enzyme